MLRPPADRRPASGRTADKQTRESGDSKKMLTFTPCFTGFDARRLCVRRPVTKTEFYVIQSVKREERNHFRRAQRAVDRMEGSRTRRRRGRRDRADQYPRVAAHGNAQRTGGQMQRSGHRGRRHVGGRSGTPRGRGDEALRRAVRLRAPLDRHVAQRTQGPHLRRPGLRLPAKDARHIGHFVPQDDPGAAQERRPARMGFDRGAELHRRTAHALRLQRHGRRQGAARIDRPQFRLYLRPREARAHQYRVAVADADHRGQRRAGAQRPHGVRGEHVAAGQRLGERLRRLRADALLGSDAQGDDAEPPPVLSPAPAISAARRSRWDSDPRYKARRSRRRACGTTGTSCCARRGGR